MRRTARASRRVPGCRGSETAYARGARPRKDWRRFPRPLCRPSRSSLRQTIQAGAAVSTLVSFRAEHGEAEESLTSFLLRPIASDEHGQWPEDRPSPTFAVERVAMEPGRPRLGQRNHPPLGTIEILSP